MNNFKQEKSKGKLGVCCSPVLFSPRSSKECETGWKDEGFLLSCEVLSSSPPRKIQLQDCSLQGLHMCTGDSTNIYLYVYIFINRFSKTIMLK